MGKNQKEPTLKEMCTRLCGTLFLGLEHKLQGESGAYRQWAKIAADLEVGAHPHAVAQKIISAIEETQEKYGTESARILYNTQAVPYAWTMMQQGKQQASAWPNRLPNSLESPRTAWLPKTKTGMMTCVFWRTHRSLFWKWGDAMTEQAWGLIALCGGMLLVLIIASIFTQRYSLNRIKSKTVGDGQHGTARWATPKEIRKTYVLVPFQVEKWRRGENRPEAQGIVLGCIGRASVKAKKHSKHGGLKALVDCDDVHFLMIGASGVGKTAFFLYPNLEYACACGMSFLALDTKGDLARNYGAIASKYYGYKISVIDLRNPTRSDGNNLLTLINRYMDLAQEDPSNLAARAKAEKYAKILAKTIVNPSGDASSYGQNAYFYDSAEGLLTAVVLLLAEYLPPTKEDSSERRHIVSVFKLVQDLLESPGPRQKNYFQQLMAKLPENHKSKWFAGAALNTSDQAMASVMSTVLSRLNAFLDSELEQVICFDSAIDAETFASEKCAIFLILPEEDTTKNFMAGLMIQNLSRELFAVADENGGKLKNRVVLFCDELGTMPPFDILPLFSAGRSRRLTLVPIIQSLAQLEKNYGKEGSEIIQDNCQDRPAL